MAMRSHHNYEGDAWLAVKDLRSSLFMDWWLKIEKLIASSTPPR